MIKLKVIKDEIKYQHILISTTQPMRVEISNVNGRMLAHVYRGNKINMNQEPCGCYDANILGKPIYDENEDWIVETTK
jgi:hypothetical protein